MCPGSNKGNRRLSGFISLTIDKSLGFFRILELKSVMLDECPSVIVTATSKPIFESWVTTFRHTVYNKVSIYINYWCHAYNVTVFSSNWLDHDTQQCFSQLSVFCSKELPINILYLILYTSSIKIDTKLFFSSNLRNRAVRYAIDEGLRDIIFISMADDNLFKWTTEGKVMKPSLMICLLHAGETLWSRADIANKDGEYRRRVGIL